MPAWRLGGLGFHPIQQAVLALQLLRTSQEPGGEGGESGLAELHWDAAPTLPGGGTAAPALWTLTSTPGTPERLCAGPHGHAHPGPGGLSAAARLCLAWSPQVPESLLLLEGVGQPLLSLV